MQGWELLVFIAFVVVIVLLIIFLVPTSGGNGEELSIGHTAEVLLLTCLDYRFLGRINAFMVQKGLAHNFDHFVLAGASLGLAPETNFMIAEWQETWWNHLQLAIDLHKIKSVYIMDHEDCGAYREFIGFNNEVEDIANPNIIPAAEVQIHSQYLRQAYQRIRARYPNINVELYIIGLKQDVVTIPPP